MHAVLIECRNVDSSCSDCQAKLLIDGVKGCSLASSHGYDLGKADGKRVDILCATPNVTKVVAANNKFLKYLEVLVLDEGDCLLDTSFLEHCDELLSLCKKNLKQLMLFSATLPPRVLELANSITPNALVARLGSPLAASKNLSQELVPVDFEDGKFVVLKQMLEECTLVPPGLIFVQDKARADNLKAKLETLELKVGAIHSDMTPAKREEIMQQFRSGKLWFLVCTDVLSRGIDCYGVQLVLNYDFPTSRESYIHRIGRAGRANCKGKVRPCLESHTQSHRVWVQSWLCSLQAVTFYTEADKPNLRLVVTVMKESGCEIAENIANPPKIRRPQSELHTQRRHKYTHRDRT